MSAVTAKDVKALRDRTGAGMLDCRNALSEVRRRHRARDRDVCARADRPRRRSARGPRRARASSRATSTPAARSACWSRSNCQTDFVARNEKFVEFARDLALHIAAAAPLAVSEEDVPAEDREREERIATEQAADRPENVRERIVTGKLDKWLDEVVLLRQKHVNEDKHGGKTIEELRAELSAETRENIVIRRFARFAVGG